MNEFHKGNFTSCWVKALGTRFVNLYEYMLLTFRDETKANTQNPFF